MNHYVEMRVRNVPDISPRQIAAKTIERLHIVLAANSQLNIGLSFPDLASESSAIMPGFRIRLHSDLSALNDVLAADRLRSITDYLDISPAIPIPNQTKHMTYRRYRPYAALPCRRRRHMRRHQVDYQTACQQIPDSRLESCSLPFLTMHSHSTGQRFRIYIQPGPIMDSPVSGSFNSYGLSSGATVPHF